MPLTTIKLLGALGDEFGREHRLDISSTREASWALQQIFPRFKSWILEQAQHGLAYEVWVGSWNIEEKHLDVPNGGETITIIPVIEGSGKIGGIIAGVALIGLAFSGVGFLGLSPLTLGLLGGALLLSGIVGGKQTQPKSNLVFSGTTNTSNIGQARPLVFGIHMVGSVTCSAYIKTYITS